MNKTRKSNSSHPAEFPPELLFDARDVEGDTCDSWLPILIEHFQELVRYYDAYRFKPIYKIHHNLSWKKASLGRLTIWYQKYLEPLSTPLQVFMRLRLD